MTARVASWLSWPSLVRSAAQRVRLAWRLMREPRVSWLLKAIPVLAGLYIISPLDFIPDVLPIIGQVDDAGILFLGIEALTRFAPADAIAFHEAAIAARRRFSQMPHGGEVIDAQFRREP